jgi:hypothetical protein
VNVPFIIPLGALEPLFPELFLTGGESNWRRKHERRNLEHEAHVHRRSPVAFFRHLRGGVSDRRLLPSFVLFSAVADAAGMARYA